MPQTPVTSKTSMTRAQRRAILRQQLRDTDASGTVWSNTVLNDCLNEALAAGQRRGAVPGVARPDQRQRLYDLPADFVRMIEVAAYSNDNDTGVDFDPRPGGRVLAGYQVSAGPPMGLSSTLGSDTAKHVLLLQEDTADDETLYITFVSAMQDYGDATVVDSGVDTVAQDLCPGELTDGVAPLLLYAAARTAAHRHAMNYIVSDGGDDHERQYEHNLRERDRYLAQITATPRGLRFSSGLF